MKIISRYLKTAVLLSLLGFTSTAMATTGYFALGYGAKSMGMVGATVSNPQDSIAAASNPAGMALVGERADFSVRFFSPRREAELTTSVLGAGSAFGAPYDVDDDSRRNLFIIPNIGFTQQVKGNDKLWWGLSLYGNGGLNATYDRNIYDEAFAALGAAGSGIPASPSLPPGCDPTIAPGLPGGPPPGSTCAGFVPEGTTTGLPNTSVLGVDLSQAIIAPTISYEVDDKHSLGASLLIGVQRFSARGLGDFQCFTNSAATNPLNTACGMGFAAFPSTGLTNNGNDWSYGAGVRLGWIGEVSPVVTLGLAASSKIYMSEFDDYDELFAEDGDLDIPASVTAGLTVKATPKLTISFDYQRIFYEGVNSISNAGPILNTKPPIPPPGQTTPPSFDPTIPGGGPNSEWLGRDDGLGFGWEDINVYRLAAEYRHNDQWTLRAGFALNDQPIPDDQVLFNILAPATIEKHATLGFTYSPNNSSEWSFAYMHAFEEEVKTARSAFGIPAEIKMYQDSIDLSYTLKF